MIMMQNDLSSHPLEPVSWNFRVFATKGLGCPTSDCLSLITENDHLKS